METSDATRATLPCVFVYDRNGDLAEIIGATGSDGGATSVVWDVASAPATFVQHPPDSEAAL